jgi:hypothetical protein
MLRGGFAVEAIPAGFYSAISTYSKQNPHFISANWNAEASDCRNIELAKHETVAGAMSFAEIDPKLYGNTFM